MEKVEMIKSIFILLRKDLSVCVWFPFNGQTHFIETSEMSQGN